MDQAHLRKAIASGSEEITLRVGKAELVLRRIPPGEFSLGSPPADRGAQSDEMPLQRVRISTAFYLGKFQVTQQQYREIMGQHESKFHGDSLPVQRYQVFVGYRIL